MTTSAFTELETFITAEMECWHVPGVAVGILHNGETYTAGFGVTNVAHPLAVDSDTLFQIGSTTKTITATIAGAIGMLASFGKFAMFFGDRRNNPLGIIGVLAAVIIGPIAAMFVQMAISRSREYEADRIGAEICGHPDWLADALYKMAHGAQTIDNPQAEDNPATAHLFIVNPLHARAIGKLFSTHPPIGERIQRLREMADQPTPARGGPWG